MKDKSNRNVGQCGTNTLILWKCLNTAGVSRQATYLRRLRTLGVVGVHKNGPGLLITAVSLSITKTSKCCILYNYHFTSKLDMCPVLIKTEEYFGEQAGLVPKPETHLHKLLKKYCFWPPTTITQSYAIFKKKKNGVKLLPLWKISPLCQQRLLLLFFLHPSLLFPIFLCQKFPCLRHLVHDCQDQSGLRVGSSFETLGDYCWQRLGAGYYSQKETERD